MRVEPRHTPQFIIGLLTKKGIPFLRRFILNRRYINIFCNMPPKKIKIGLYKITELIKGIAKMQIIYPDIDMDK